MKKTKWQLYNQSIAKQWIEEMLPKEVYENAASNDTAFDKMLKQLDENQNGKKK